MIKEGVATQHPAVMIPARPKSHVGLCAAVRAMKTTLSEGQPILLLIERNKQVELRVFHREMLVDIQLHARGAELAHPCLHLLRSFAHGHAARHRRSRLPARVIGQEIPGLRCHTGYPRRLCVTVWLSGFCVIPGLEGRRRHIQFVAGLQVVKPACETAELVELAQLRLADVVFFGDRGHRFACRQRVGLRLRRRGGGLLQEAARGRYRRGKAHCQRKAGLDTDVYPGQRSPPTQGSARRFAFHYFHQWIVSVIQRTSLWMRPFVFVAICEKTCLMVCCAAGQPWLAAPCIPPFCSPLRRHPPACSGAGRAGASSGAVMATARPGARRGRIAQRWTAPSFTEKTRKELYN